MDILQEHLPALLAVTLAAVGAYAGIAFRWHKEALRRPGSAREWRLQWVRNNSFQLLYKDALLEPVLVFISKYLTRDQILHEEPDGPPRIRPLTVGSFEFCLRCSFIIPPIILICVWSLGFSVKLGNNQIFPEPEDSPLLLRLLVFFAVLSSATNWHSFAQSSGYRRMLWAIIFVPPFLPIAYMFSLGYTAPLIAAFALTNLRDTRPVLTGIIFWSFGSAIVTLLDRKQPMDYLLILFVITVGLKIWVGSNLVVSPKIPNIYKTWRLIYFLVYVLSIYYFSLSIPRQSPQAEFMAWNAYLFAILPVIYTHISWLGMGVGRASLEATRLGRSSGPRTFFIALFDIVLIVVCVSLGSALVALVSSLTDVINQIGGNKTFFDFIELLNDVQMAPASSTYWWIYAVFGFILLPIIVHLTLASGALMLWAPSKMVTWATSGWNNSEDLDIDKLNVLGAYLTVAPVLGFIGLAVSLTLFVSLVNVLLFSQTAQSANILLITIRWVYEIASKAGYGWFIGALYAVLVGFIILNWKYSIGVVVEFSKYRWKWLRSMFSK